METTKPFTLSMVGKDTNKPYNGDFVAKMIMTQREKLYADAERRRLVGPSPVGTHPAPKMQGIAYILGQLPARLVEFPDWVEDSHQGTFLKTITSSTNRTLVLKAEEEFKADMHKDAKSAAKVLREKDKDACLDNSVRKCLQVLALRAVEDPSYDEYRERIQRWHA